MNLQYFDSYPYRTLEPYLQTLVLGARRLARGIYHGARCPNRRQATTESPFCIAASPAAEGETEEEPDGQPWQMTRGEFHQARVSQGFTNPTENSRLYWQEIRKALADGKHLHPRVLREYEQLFGPHQRH
jgi:hypothetical protein